jgi:hypothetical protein
LPSKSFFVYFCRVIINNIINDRTKKNGIERAEKKTHEDSPDVSQDDRERQREDGILPKTGREVQHERQRNTARNTTR